MKREALASTIAIGANGVPLPADPYLLRWWDDGWRVVRFVNWLPGMQRAVVEVFTQPIGWHRKRVSVDALQHCPGEHPFKVRPLSSKKKLLRERL